MPSVKEINRALQAENEARMKAAHAAKGHDELLGTFEYNIPKSVYSVIGLYDKAYTGGLPGKDVIKSEMGAGYAGAMGQMERGADTGAGYLGAGTNLWSQYMKSIRDLGLQHEQMKVQQGEQKRMGQIAGQTMLADYEKERDY